MAVGVDDGPHRLRRDAVELGLDLAGRIHPLGRIDDDDAVVPLDQDGVAQREPDRHVDALPHLNHLTTEFFRVGEELGAGPELLRRRRRGRNQRAGQSQDAGPGSAHGRSGDTP